MRKILMILFIGMFMFGLVSADYRFENPSGDELMRIYSENGNLSVLGNVSAPYFFGSGKYLTDIDTSSLNLSEVNYWSKSGSDLFYNDGNVGIGTSSPTQKLDVAGNIKLDSGNTQNKIISNSTQGLVLENTGSSYGDVKLIIQNVGGMNGALFQNDGLDLADFGFVGSSGVKQNIRYERRGSNVYPGNTGGQFEIGPSDNENLVVGAGVSAFLKGNVGVGTTSPGAKLDVYTTEDNIARFEKSSGNGILYIKSSVGNTINLETGANDDLLFSPNGSEKMRIDSSGRVGVNSTNPTSTLEVKGDINVTNDEVSMYMEGTALVIAG